MEYGTLYLAAPAGYLFDRVIFASFGTPSGECPAANGAGAGGAGGTFTASNSCNSANSSAIVAALCIGKASCSIIASKSTFFGDPCPHVPKSLYVQMHYTTVAACK